MSHVTLRALALAAAAATLGVTAAQAQSSTVHIDSGTSLNGFNGSTKPGQYLRLELTPDTPAASVTVTAQNVTYSGGWQFSLNDYFGATNSPGVMINPDYSDYAASSVTIPTSQGVNFFQLPVDTFGSSYAFDLVESGPVSVGFDYKIFANDDLVQLADLRYTPGSSVPTLVSAAPGVNVMGAAPEPSEWAGLGLGVLSLGGLLLRARRRSA